MKVAIKVDEGGGGLADNFGITCIRDWRGVDLKIILNQMMLIMIANK
ncbi:hypothetical protein [Pelosinus sp. IPA-1]|nr:hypothetical protein [Pelosinus sp. IPA-1]GMA99499.1 hypothetical protein PIPA1_22990 [Pelosinus sp. IPA-1]